MQVVVANEHIMGHSTNEKRDIAEDITVTNPTPVHKHPIIGALEIYIQSLVTYLP